MTRADCVDATRSDWDEESCEVAREMKLAANARPIEGMTVILIVSMLCQLLVFNEWYDLARMRTKATFNTTTHPLLGDRVGS